MMNAADRRRALRVAAEFAAKQAVELTASAHVIGECIGNGPRARFDVEAISARTNIAAIRRELDDIEALIEGREPAVPSVAA